MTDSTSARELRQQLPHWFKMRQDKTSVGAQLLNVIGQGLDTTADLIRALGWEFTLLSANTSTPSSCYTAGLPGVAIDPDFSVEFYGDGILLSRARDLPEFLSAPVDPVVDTPEVFGRDYILIDPEQRRLYVRKSYVELRMVVLDGAEVQIADIALPLSEHPLWTVFDEYGLLWDTLRLPGESNEAYRGRLLSVPSLPAGPHRGGIIRGLARDLGLLRDYVWADGAADYPIPHRYVNIETIMINGDPVSDEEYFLSPIGQVILKGDVSNPGPWRVTYAYGLSLHTFASDDPIMDELLTDEGLATSQLWEYQERIERTAPALWGGFVWGESFWDPGNDGLVPSIYDASIEGWRTV